MGKDGPQMPRSKEFLCFQGHGRISVPGGAHKAGGMPLALGMDPQMSQEPILQGRTM